MEGYTTGTAGSALVEEYCPVEGYTTGTARSALVEEYGKCVWRIISERTALKSVLMTSGWSNRESTGKVL